MQYQQAELARAVTILTNTIHNCEKMQRKFAEGTSQHTLLKNRIKALNISKALLTNDRTMTFTVEELRKALPPVSPSSIKLQEHRINMRKGVRNSSALNP